MRHRFLVIAILAAMGVMSLAPLRAQNSEVIEIDATSQAQPFPHFWEQVFGSERAAVTLRESYRLDLREVKQITDLRYVRFHAIFHDEVGIYSEDEHGQPIYNFSYVDQIYDGLLSAHKCMAIQPRTKNWLAWVALLS